MDHLPAQRSPRTTSFMIIWIGQAFSLFGSQLVQFALIWWLTQKTGSATVLATASLVGLIPQVLLGPLVGALVDRWNRRLIMLAADSAIALATVGLAYLFWVEAVEIWHVYLIMFIRALGGSFHWPAMTASMSLMVPEKHLARVQGLNQTLQGGLNIISAPLGAVLLGFLPIQGILAIDVVTALLAILPLLFIAVPQPRRGAEAAGTSAPARKSLWSDMREGLRYVWAWPGLIMIMVMATVINMVLNPASSLTPILVTEHFQGGPLQLGWIESAWGIGVVAGGVLLGVWGGFKRRILTSLAGLIALGLFIMIVGLAPASAFPLAVGAMFMVGIANPITNGPLLAVVQAVVAPDMQGRVFSLIGSMAMAATPLGLIIAGPVADLTGPRIWFVVGGIVTTALGVGALFVPAVVYLEDQMQAARQEVARTQVVELAADDPLTLPVG
ncbi:MAG: MFS transporter [Chloroflexi bacterium]|nr:MFS transporter [Chloroflexota bacterium]MCI0645082.1 MFS transporter [Chloroflexota bacterium]MCI0731917.1 MFS transporter [Chloroflexota bacterium]